MLLPDWLRTETSVPVVEKQSLKCGLSWASMAVNSICSNLKARHYHELEEWEEWEDEVKDDEISGSTLNVEQPFSHFTSLNLFIRKAALSSMTHYGVSLLFTCYAPIQNLITISFQIGQSLNSRSEDRWTDYPWKMANLGCPRLPQMFKLDSISQQVGLALRGYWILLHAYHNERCVCVCVWMSMCPYVCQEKGY